MFRRQPSIPFPRTSQDPKSPLIVPSRHSYQDPQPSHRDYNAPFPPPRKHEHISAHPPSHHAHFRDPERMERELPTPPLPMVGKGVDPRQRLYNQGEKPTARQEVVERQGPSVSASVESRRHRPREEEGYQSSRVTPQSISVNKHGSHDARAEVKGNRETRAPKQDQREPRRARALGGEPRQKEVKVDKQVSMPRDRLGDDLEEDLTCPICMSVFVGAQHLVPCGHTLCGPCVVTWLTSRAESSEEVNCPTCRKRLSANTPLVPAHTVDNMIVKWVENKRKSRGGWDGLKEWEERAESWNLHKQYNPTLVHRLQPPTPRLTEPNLFPGEFFEMTNGLSDRREGRGTRGDIWVSTGMPRGLPIHGFDIHNLIDMIHSGRPDRFFELIRGGGQPRGRGGNFAIDGFDDDLWGHLFGPDVRSTRR